MRKVVVVLVIALLASVAVSYSLWNQLRAERALTAQLRAQPRIVAPAMATPATRSPEPVENTSRVARPPIAATTPPTESPRGNGRPPDWRSQQQRLMQDPR